MQFAALSSTAASNKMQERSRLKNASVNSTEQEVESPAFRPILQPRLFILVVGGGGGGGGGGVMESDVSASVHQ
jgi:hypothetical protein